MIRVLFVATDNNVCGAMGAAFLRARDTDFEVHCATPVSSAVRSLLGMIVAETDGRAAQSLSEPAASPEGPWDVVISVGATLPESGMRWVTRRVMHWTLSDPEAAAGMSARLAALRDARDLVRQHVAAFADSAVKRAVVA